jgi:hypothetical protein
MAAKKWAEIITASWRKSVAAFFETGDNLLAAKDERPGTFQRMIEHELPFGQRTAEMLMAIAADRRLRDPNHGSLLPSSWRTLYAISRMTDEEFAVAIGNGLIHPEVQRAEIEGRFALPAGYRPNRREFASTLSARRYVSSGRSDPDGVATPTFQLAVQRSERSIPLSAPIMPPQDYAALALIRALVESDAKTRALAVKLLPWADLALASKALSELTAGLKRRRAKKGRGAK